MDVLCKCEEDPITNEGARVFKHFPHYNTMGAIVTVLWR